MAEIAPAMPSLSSSLNTPLTVMEDHDGAYHAWKNAGLKEKTLLHFDAHIDFNWIAPEASSLLEEKNLQDIYSQIKKTPFWNTRKKSQEERVNLGNYIHQAIQSGIVNRFIWIYPDHPDTHKQEQAVSAILRSIGKTYAASFKIIRENGGIFHGEIYNKPFMALPYQKLSILELGEKVLLDIDLDFFIISSLHSTYYPFTDELNQPRAWLTPAEFCAGLEEHEVSSDWTTLAYSIEEGYTPLITKFLGDELAERLGGALSEEREKYYAVLRDSLRGDTPEKVSNAIEELNEMVDIYPREAALHFHLSMHLLERSEIENARLHYLRALECDSSYRTPYNHAGPALEDLCLYKEADASFAKMRRLDGNHPSYQLHEIKKLLSEKKWPEALELCKSIDAAELSPQSHLRPRLLLAKAECLLGLHKAAEAWSLLESYEPENYAIETAYYVLRASAAQKTNRIEEAIEAYHALLQRWWDLDTVHFALANLYFRKKNFFKAKNHLLKGLHYFFLAPIARALHRRDR